MGRQMHAGTWRSGDVTSVTWFDLTSWAREMHSVNESITRRRATPLSRAAADVAVYTAIIAVCLTECRSAEFDV